MQNKFYKGDHAYGADAVLHDTNQEAEYFIKKGCSAQHLYWPYCLEFWKEVESDDNPGRLIKERYALCSGSAGRDLESLEHMVGEKDLLLIVTGQIREGLMERKFKNPKILAKFNSSYEDWVALLYHADFAVVSVKYNERHIRGGSTVLKALQLGKPVLTDRYHKDYVEDGVSGVLVDWKNKNALKEAYTKLSNDQDFLHRLEEQAKLRGRSFNYEYSTSQLLKLLMKV
ncbi:MAG: glycosyltransferase [Bacteroidota bacterium]